MNCANNYGPRQFRKLIPPIIMRVLSDGTLPIYGDGENFRDWLFVDDHCEANWQVLRRGNPGQTYAVGGGESISEPACKPPSSSVCRTELGSTVSRAANIGTGSMRTT